MVGKVKRVADWRGKTYARSILNWQAPACRNLRKCSMCPTKVTGSKLQERVQALVRNVNRKVWWHVPPQDPTAYSKRGKFFASSFSEAEFYGRPLDIPERVTIAKPLVGDERTIAKVLDIPHQHEGMSLEEIATHDALWRNAALAKGFDSIVLMSPRTFAKFKVDGKPPRSLELNILVVE
jgi:hypothetical protein